MKYKFSFLALAAIACLLMPLAMAGKPSDADIKKKLLGYWRSPRHEYQFTSDGGIHVDPSPPCPPTGKWDVKDGLFYWDDEPHIIVLLTKEKFVYKPLRTMPGMHVSGAYVLLRITKEMVGDSYVPDKRFISK